MAIRKNSHFNGEAAEEIYTGIFLSQDTLAKNLVNSVENIQSDSTYIQMTDAEDNLQPYSCTFAPNNDLDLDEVKVDLVELSWMAEYCTKELRRWSASKMNGKFYDAPQNEVEALLRNLHDKLGEKVEKMLWTGDNTTNTNEFDGFLTLLGTPTDTVSQAQPSDVVAALELAIDSTKEAILQHPNFRLVVSTDVARKFNRDLNQRGFAQQELFFDGYKMETANGLPAGTILTYVSNNLHFVTNLADSFSDIKIINKAESDFSLDHTIEMRADFKGQTAIVVPTDVVWIAKA